MTWKMIFNGCSMVRRNVKVSKAAHMKIETAPVLKEGAEAPQQGQGIKAPTEADTQALRAKLRAELFREI